MLLRSQIPGSRFRLSVSDAVEPVSGSCLTLVHLRLEWDPGGCSPARSTITIGSIFRFQFSDSGLILDSEARSFYQWIAGSPGRGKIRLKEILCYRLASGRYSGRVGFIFNYLCYVNGSLVRFPSFPNSSQRRGRRPPFLPPKSCRWGYSSSKYQYQGRSV